MMDGLPSHEMIEKAYKAVEEILRPLGENNWRDRALENLKVSEGAAYQARERAGADERVTATATGGPVSTGQPYFVGESGPELFVTVTAMARGGFVTEGAPYFTDAVRHEWSLPERSITTAYIHDVQAASAPAWPQRSGRCSFPSTYCSCGSTNQGG